MKLLAFTDIHEDARLLERIKTTAREERVDLIVCTGDFTIFGRSGKKMLAAIDNLGAPVILIHGNHEDEEEVATLVKSCKNITFAHMRAKDVGGYRFIGYGGGGFRTHEPELEELERKLANQFNERTIILSHAPPYGTKLDEVDDDWHVGNQSLTALIRRRKPLLVLCGHIHECFHKHDQLAQTTLIDPGPDGEIIILDD